MRAAIAAAVMSLLALGPALAQEEGEEAPEPLKLTFGPGTPSLHLPRGSRTVEIVPAFEDYAYMLYDACDAMGLSSEQCSIFPMNGDLGGNAIATVLDGNRIVVYDRELSPKVGYEGAMGIMAHELGHHMCGHLGKRPDPRQELAADRYAGAAMRMAGYGLEGALALADALDERPSATHPGKARRIAALTEGWNAPEAAKACALR